MALNISHLENEIIDQYLYDDHPTRPWIIGFSGGKDSTMLLQVVWNALKKIEPALLTRRIYVVCNDTLVENPRIVKFINTTLKKIQKAANLNNIPLEVHQTMPVLDDTFWVKLIGLGYPAPNKFYRWCTERLKIDPTTRFIKETTSMNEEAIILLGTRSAESSNRAASIKRHEV
jgi:DNA sulfur modification protein DndC